MSEESSLARCLEDLGGLLAEEGLDALGGRHERPAFLVRPRLVDVAAAVNRYRRLTLTTESTTEKKMEGKSAGATGWIVKPFNPEKLLATVNKVLG